MFPVYRLREGKEYLGLNAAAFENSRKVLSENGIVLIFIEGICLNKHELQPFKKGQPELPVFVGRRNSRSCTSTRNRI
jgi:hypothetical protein